MLLPYSFIICRKTLYLSCIHRCTHDYTHIHIQTYKTNPKFEMNFEKFT